MGMPAARLTDLILQDSPHCHAPIHPPAPVPTPTPHPQVPFALVSAGVMNVVIGGFPAAVLGTQSMPCILPACVPAGPGLIAKGSTTVMIGGRPAGRMNDLTAHPSCVAPIPAPTGKVIPPCCPTVLIGG